jgi:hypothetical protein
MISVKEKINLTFQSILEDLKTFLKSITETVVEEIIPEPETVEIKVDIKGDPIYIIIKMMIVRLKVSHVSVNLGNNLAIMFNLTV